MDVVAPPELHDPWTGPHRDLIGRIAGHAFESGDALDFTQRLAREHRWSAAFARGAVQEYGRFCFLAITSSNQVTPSEEVDEVWHLHLTYSRDYWTVWCPTVLQVPLHHNPTRGGPAEQTRFRAQYAATLAGYERYFGPPPAAFWPATHRRFGPAPRYAVLDTHRNWAVRRPQTWFKNVG